MISEFYARFQSLHIYVPFLDANEFVGHISGRRGEGYENWRYALIQDTNNEENAPPLNSGDAMLAVWQATVLLADRSIREDESSIIMYDEFLRELLYHVLMDCQDEVLRTANSVNGDGELVHREINEWLTARGDILNAFSAIIRRQTMVGNHGVGVESELAGRIWRNSWREFKSDPRRTTYSNLACFVNRAQGRYSVGRGVSWDSESQRFRSIPWTLDGRYAEAPPQNSIEVRYWGAVPDKRHRLYRAAGQGGYLVLENHWFGGLPENHRWMQTLEVRSDSTPNSFCVLELWEGPYRQDRAYLRVSCELEQLAPDLRTVIEYHQRQNRMAARPRH